MIYNSRFSNALPYTRWFQNSPEGSNLFHGKEVQRVPKAKASSCKLLRIHFPCVLLSVLLPFSTWRLPSIKQLILSPMCRLPREPSGGPGSSWGDCSVGNMLAKQVWGPVFRSQNLVKGRHFLQLQGSYWEVGAREGKVPKSLMFS